MILKKNVQFYMKQMGSKVFSVVQARKSSGSLFRKQAQIEYQKHIHHKT